MSQVPNPRVVKICLTGGPCSGKTTALTAVSARLRALGWKVFTVPEVATLTAQNGGMIIMDGLTGSQTTEFFSLFLRAVRQFEDYFEGLARVSKKPSIILCDRGTMDGVAYAGKDLWDSLMRDSKESDLSMRNARYDAVIHLVTAADGAVESYNLDSNAARFEDEHEARAIDEKLLTSWLGHHNHIVVQNILGEAFEKKIERTIAVVEKILNEGEAKVPINEQVKVEGVVNLKDFVSTVVEVEIEETTLEEEADKKIKFSKLSEKHSVLFTEETTEIKNGKHTQQRRVITAVEYQRFQEQNPSESKKLTRQVFLHDKQPWVIETDQKTLEIKLRVGGVTLEKCTPPSFIKIQCERNENV